MLKIVFYFQVHQPFRLKPYRVLDIGADPDYFDENLNSQVMKKVAEKCYLPTNKLLLELIDKYEGQFRVAFSITGTAIEQFRLYAPEVLDSFRLLAQSGASSFSARPTTTPSPSPARITTISAGRSSSNRSECTGSSWRASSASPRWSFEIRSSSTTTS